METFRLHDGVELDIQLPLVPTGPGMGLPRGEMEFRWRRDHPGPRSVFTDQLHEGGRKLDDSLFQYNALHRRRAQGCIGEPCMNPRHYQLHA